MHLRRWRVYVWVGECVRPGDSLKIVLMLRFLSPLSPCGFTLDPADITKIMPSQSQPSFNHSFQTCQHMPSVPLSYGLALSLSLSFCFCPSLQASPLCSCQFSTLGERWSFEMHIQGCWTLACVLCWVIVEAKCLITCDRHSSGGPRRSGLQNNTQLSSDLHLYYHPKHGKDFYVFLLQVFAESIPLGWVCRLKTGSGLKGGSREHLCRSATSDKTTLISNLPFDLPFDSHVGLQRERSGGNEVSTVSD